MVGSYPKTVLVVYLDIPHLQTFRQKAEFRQSNKSQEFASVADEDNVQKNYASMANHLNRPEIAQALKKGKEYIGITSFSHDGLIKQLKYDKFTDEQAAYAADNCGADWNEQAVGAAKDYLEFMNNPSHDELVDQLKYDGFTPDQAEYGATHAGV